MKLKKFISGGIGGAGGTIICECYSKSWANVDWYRVAFVATTTILLVILVSVQLPKRDTEA